MMVDRYTNQTEQTDFPDGFTDCGALRSSRRTVRTMTTTFAKVRVASSNLVIRSVKTPVSSNAGRGLGIFGRREGLSPVGPGGNRDWERDLRRRRLPTQIWCKRIADGRRFGESERSPQRRRDQRLASALVTCVMSSSWL